MPAASTLEAAGPAEAARSVFKWISKSERLTDHECLNLYAGTARVAPRLAGCDRGIGASGMLERTHEPRKLISGALQNREQVYEEACHDAGMSAQHKHKANEDQPANSPAHDYRSSDAASIRLSVATRAATTTAMCSLLARVAVGPETMLIQATYPHAPSVGMSVLDRGHAGQGRVIVAGNSARIASDAATAMIQPHNPTPQAADN